MCIRMSRVQMPMDRLDGCMYGCMDGAQVSVCTTVYNVREDMTRFDGKLQVSLSPSVVLVSNVV